MKTGKIRKRQGENKEKDPDETDFEEMLEKYIMVPPSPYLLKKRRKEKTSNQK